MTPADRRTLLAMRAWRPEERRVVQRGMLGRFTIAIEPALLSALFAVFGLWLATHGQRDAARDDRIFSVIFFFGSAAFAVYGVALMLVPLHALRETAKPIFIVDGYVRTRSRDDFSASGSNGYVAVLTHDQRVACEWPSRGTGDLPYVVRPAQSEFSEYGGIHTIDGVPTGVLPLDFPPLGIGAAKM